MSQIITDLSVPKEWIARRGVNNQFTLTFTEDGNPFDLTNYTFVLSIRKIGGNTQKLQLTQGSGITNGGGTGILSIQLTEANTETLKAQSYFYSLEYTVGGLSYGLLHSTLSLVQQYNDQPYSNDFTVSVNLQGTDLNMAVTVAGQPGLNVLTQTSTSTLTPSPTYEAFELTAQAAALTIANPSSNYENFECFVIRIKDNGTARGLTFGNKYRAQGEALPTTTTISKVMVIVCMYDSTADKYDISFSEEV